MNITDNIISAIKKLQIEKETVIIAIDGRCASGKTTLADTLQKEFICNVFHMDDFFLRPEQRTKERYSSAGGNVDRERFEDEILKKISKNEPFSYRAFDCKTMNFSSPVEIEPRPLGIVEGAYSCHPDLWDYYDLHIFLTLPYEKQIERIRERNGGDVKKFTERWIPMEEKYFEHFKIDRKCELIVNF